MELHGLVEKCEGSVMYGLRSDEKSSKGYVQLCQLKYRNGIVAYGVVERCNGNVRYGIKLYCN